MTLLLSIARWIRDRLVDTRPTCGDPLCLDRSRCEACQDAEAI